MTNITLLVQRLLDHDTAARRCLARGIINKRALAYELKQGLPHQATVDAIISALRRFESDAGDAGDAGEDHFAKAAALIKNAKISTRTGVTIVTLRKGSAVESFLPRLFSEVDYSRGEALRIIQAEESIKIIVDERNAEKVLGIFKASIVSREGNLAELNMKLVPLSAKVPGVLAILQTELANNGINVVEFISCVPELLWFVSQKDLLKAHQTFLELIDSLSEVTLRERKN